MNVTEMFRRLRWNEVVRPGDFVEDERAGLKPWDGLTGFRAGTFVATVYRKKHVPSLKK
jgi:hypothetical protein